MTAAGSHRTPFGRPSYITAPDFSLPHGAAYDGDATAFPRVARYSDHTHRV
jgi:hypothetical protein